MNDFVASNYQAAVLDWVQAGSGDAVVSAVAGSGKSTTILQAAAQIRSGNAIMFAFNRHIAKELSDRLHAAGSRMAALTIHGYGYRTLRRAGFIKGDPDALKYRRISERAITFAIEPALRQMLAVPKLATEAQRIVKARVQMATKLAEMARLTLSDPDEPADLLALVNQYDLGDVDGPASEGVVMRALPGILDEGARAIERGSIDFTDMIWGPTRLGIKPAPWDWALVDEAQDLSAAQRELVLAGRGPGGRGIWVGDPFQAIFGFAGADAHSYRAIKERTAAVELPLSICYRCPTSHLGLAKRLVPHIEARPGAATGGVSMITEAAFLETVKEQALVLCRTTAPLIAMCLRLIRRRLPARVRGRDVAKAICDLARTVDRIEPDYRRFVGAIATYTTDQCRALEQREGTAEKVQRLHDMAEALEACALEFVVDDVSQLCREIEALFTDEAASIWLSTGHRAKGLEAADVYILRPGLLPFEHPRMTEDQRKQEVNLFYVMLTRSTRQLTFVYETQADIPDEPVVPLAG